MADDKYTFEQARIRLEEIAVEVRKKDTSLEKSLDLLEEGVRLANICTELVDHTDTGASVVVPAIEQPQAPEIAGTASEAGEPETRVADEPPASADDAEGFEEADDEVLEPADSEVEE